MNKVKIFSTISYNRANSKRSVFMFSKKRCHLLTSLLLAVSLILSGCSSASTSKPETDVQDTKAANEAFETFTYNLFCDEVVASTIDLHFTLQNPEAYGIKETPITFGSFEMDEEAERAVLENYRTALDDISYESLSEENQITYDVLYSTLETSMEGLKYYYYDEPLNSITGLQAQLPVLLAEYAFTCEEDVRTYLDLIETLPEYFDSLMEFEREKADAGLFMASCTLDSIVEQCEAFISMGEDNYLLSTFEERVNELDSISAENKASYIARNRELLDSAIVPAYEALISDLESLRSFCTEAEGVCRFPEGTDYYSYVVKRDTGSSRTVEQLESLISSQMLKDIMEMQAIMMKNPDYAEETVSIPSTEPAAILNNLETDIIDAFPEPADVEFKIKYVPEALQEYLSPAFYLIPAIDNTAENVIYINEGQNVDDVTLFTTLAHEGYPGHLYQTTYYASTDPNPVRHILSFGGYTEGWATYAEMYSYSLAPLEEDYATLLQKNNSLILGLYANTDIGIHYYGWTPEDTLEYYSSFGISDEEIIQEIYEMIIADPGNYLKYYIGYVEFLQLEEKAMETFENEFSYKEFHKTILEIGPAPFEIVEKYLFN